MGVLIHLGAWLYFSIRRALRIGWSREPHHIGQLLWVTQDLFAESRYYISVSVTDGLTGVTQSITYQSSGNGIGNVSEVDQTGGLNPAYQVGGAHAGYTTLYGYSAIGDRTSSTWPAPFFCTSHNIRLPL